MSSTHEGVNKELPYNSFDPEPFFVQCKRVVFVSLIVLLVSLKH